MRGFWGMVKAKRETFPLSVRTVHGMLRHMPRRPLFYLGADHAGFALKEAVKSLLTKKKIPFIDLSPTLIPNDDYPLVGKRVADQITTSKDAQGILVCGSGMGIAIAANRVQGVRATVIQEPRAAVLARSEDHANVLVLGGRVLSLKQLPAILDAWLATKPSRQARHVRRAQELDTL